MMNRMALQLTAGCKTPIIGEVTMSGRQFQVFSLSGSPIVSIEEVKRVKKKNSWNDISYEVETKTRKHKITIPKKQAIIIEAEVL